MEMTSQLKWNPVLVDPTGRRQMKPRTLGKTMVMDKGLGLLAFQDLIQTSQAHVDMIKLGFGTSVLYPQAVLRSKINLAKENGILIYPGGTFLEAAVHQNAVDSFFDMIIELGFNAVEISDGTIHMERRLRNELIARGLDEGLAVITEYGKKGWGSTIELAELIETVLIDSELGASLVTIEARESGKGVGIFDDNGACKDEELQSVLASISGELLLWEAPLKHQQVHLIRTLGADIHLGNISPDEVIALEALRRGLRSDTLISTIRKG
ncbi:phosphosulfolactate synthase [Paenibacillus roseipurpureus]|uniref:Phosphosulfolactate synthase n=1 Tax=Paenibacillus roseopurpureus TaxID=2918901 RepID=A0AA96LK47_9BACL|nr:phosphosulfolactate synthase [Paenibacillus sp. MBLB1832]WNR42567.1 phosphosulfolactate synthase [Paenibacillus sp. MBLB1832]